MRSLQFTLRRSWDQIDQTALVSWTPEIRLDLEWWLDRERLELGVALDQVSPQLGLWSDASGVGWGAHLGEEVASGLWSPEESDVSVNARELLAIERVLRCFALQIRNSSVAIFADNSTAFAYLRNRGNTVSSAEFHRSADLTMVGISSIAVDYPIHHGPSQCFSGLVVSSE